MRCSSESGLIVIELAFFLGSLAFGWFLAGLAANWIGWIGHPFGFIVRGGFIRFIFYLVYRK